MSAPEEASLIALAREYATVQDQPVRAGDPTNPELLLMLADALERRTREHESDEALAGSADTAAEEA